MKAGSSKYQIEDHHVIRIHECRKVFNKHVNAVVEHEVFYWIMRVSRKKPRGRPQRRDATVLECLVPKIQSMRSKCLVVRKQMQLRTLMKYMTNGYETITERCLCNYTWESYKRFYRLIDVIPGGQSVRQGGRTDGIGRMLE